MTFLTDVEEVDVDIEEFNELVGYDETYRPQGFTRVADKRLDQLAGEESVETAIADLTDAGERVHPSTTKTTKTTDQLPTSLTNSVRPAQTELLTRSSRNLSRRPSPSWGVPPTGSREG